VNNLGADLGVQAVDNAGADPERHSILDKSVAIQEEGAVEDVPSSEHSSQTNFIDTTELEMALKEWMDEEENSKPASAEELVAIPEASPEQSVARSSKRRVGEADEEVGVMAECHKALRNEGKSVEPTHSSHVTDSMVISNLNVIGISLEVDDASISESMDNIREKALGCLQEHIRVSLKDNVLEKDEKELLEEEELQKLFLKNICIEIMEGVVDLGSDCDVILPRGYNSKKITGRGGHIKDITCREMRGVFWNCNGFKDPKKHRFISDLTREQDLCSIAILETGRKGFNDFVLRNLCGGRNFLWHCKEPRGCLGGILLGIDLDTFDIGAIDEGDFYINFHLCNKDNNFKWALVAIYGPV
jgi:hypothetical protein